LQDQIVWSTKTFGPGLRTKGVIDHIKKELVEIEENPFDLEEWIDVVILALDGAWRAGYTPAEVLQQYRSKMAINFDRQWPDWRESSEDVAIEHIR
jgi:hypothetical protein